MSTLFQWTIDCLMAMAELHTRGKGLPVVVIREALAVKTAIEGYAPTDAQLYDATVEICRALYETGTVALRGDTLYLNVQQAPQATQDESSLN